MLIGPIQVTGNRHKHQSRLCRLTLCTHILSCLFTSALPLLMLSFFIPISLCCLLKPTTANSSATAHLVFITVQQKPSIPVRLFRGGFPLRGQHVFVVLLNSLWQEYHDTQHTRCTEANHAWVSFPMCTASRRTKTKKNVRVDPFAAFKL